MNPIIAFRDSEEILGSKQNGNFVGIMELISQFDPFLKQHLQKFGNQGCDKQSYLSTAICEELILLMREKIRKFIVSELGVAQSRLA